MLDLHPNALLQMQDHFPFLKRQVHGKRLAFLDSAASSQMPLEVIERMDVYHRSQHANVHRGIHQLSQEATAYYESCRSQLQSLIGAKSEAEIIFTSGATDALNLVAYSWGLTNLNEGDQILVSEMEHHANMVPWQMIANRTGAKVLPIGITDEGEIDLDHYQSVLNERVKVVAITHVSNVLGTVNPIKKMADMAHQVGAVVVVDGCQATPHLQVNVAELGADFYAFSAHKMYGPTGIGVLWGREALLEAMPPFRGGGDMIDRVSFDGTTFNELPHKFEAGTPPIVSGIGFDAALKFIQGIGYERIHSHESHLMNYALDKLTQIEDIHIFGASPSKHAVISFNLGEIHPHDLGTILDQQGVAVRTGHHCAQPLMKRLNQPATARASFAIYNTEEDVDQLLEALQLAQEIFS